MVDGATDLLLQVELNTISTILHLPMALLVAYLSFIGQEKKAYEILFLSDISHSCVGGRSTNECELVTAGQEVNVPCLIQKANSSP